MIQIYLTKGIVRFQDKYLFLRKAKDFIKENIGKWECPGGKINENEDAIKAILREVNEETNLNCKLIRELPLLQMFDEKYDSKCHVFLLEANSDKVGLSKEHSEYKWIKAEEVKNIQLVLFASLLLEYFNNSEIYLNRL